MTGGKTGMSLFTKEDAEKLLAFGGYAVIPAGVTSIDHEAFQNCISLTSIEIPASVKSVCSRAFSNCSGLTKIKIPEGINIGSHAFSDCIRLSEITIPYSADIGSFAFSNCINLTSVKIPDDIARLANGAFYGCNNLTVYCEKNSTAYKYCRQSNIKVKILKNLPEIKEKVKHSRKQEKAEDKTELLPNKETVEIPGIFSKIDAFIDKISSFKKYISGSNISNELDNINLILYEMKNLLGEKIDFETQSKQLDQFLNCYSAIIIKILEDYYQIEYQGSSDKNVVETKERIIKLILSIKKAFVKQYESMYEHKIFDVNTDIDTVETMLALDGFLEK